MQRHVRRVLVYALGWTLVSLGVLGLLLPILPGLLLLLVGLSVLAAEWDRAHRWHVRLREHLDERVGHERVARWRKILVGWLPGRDRTHDEK